MDFDPSQVKHHALYPLTDDPLGRWRVASTYPPGKMCGRVPLAWSDVDGSEGLDADSVAWVREENVFELELLIARSVEVV